VTALARAVIMRLTPAMQERNWPVFTLPAAA
jgi:hypothetical protein